MLFCIFLIGLKEGLVCVLFTLLVWAGIGLVRVGLLQLRVGLLQDAVLPGLVLSECWPASCMG